MGSKLKGRGIDKRPIKRAEPPPIIREAIAAKGLGDLSKRAAKTGINKPDTIMA